MKLALFSHGLVGWGGGIDFIRYIASSIATSDSIPLLKKSLILPRDDILLQTKKYLYPIKSFINQLSNCEKLKWNPWPGFSETYFRTNFLDLKQSFDLVYCGSTYKAQLAMTKSINANVILPCLIPPQKDFPIPWVGYLYDFQHYYFPDFFSPQEIKRRSKSFTHMLYSANHIIVNAHSVAHDALTFYPNCKAKLHVLPFSPCPHKEWLDSNLEVRQQYGIDKSYFIIANQFWKHKNHRTAFLAFAHYLQMGGQALLVCTGSTKDYRFPNYFIELCEFLKELGIFSKVRILGHIPKIDQISLIKNALAVIQPTLFEGGPGGGASYDAISLGVPVIASDIPVNLEMNCGMVNFFKSGDEHSLADALFDRGHKDYSRPKNELLWMNGLARRRFCGNFILDVAHQAIQNQ